MRRRASAGGRVPAARDEQKQFSSSVASYLEFFFFLLPQLSLFTVRHPEEIWSEGNDGDGSSRRLLSRLVMTTSSHSNSGPAINDTRFEKLLQQERIIQSAAMRPDEVPSCMNLFDAWASCFGEHAFHQENMALALPSY